MKQGKLTDIINEATALNEVKLHKSLSQQCEKASDFLFELIERYSRTLKNEGLLTSEEMTTLDAASDILYQLAYDIAHVNGLDEKFNGESLTESKLNEDYESVWKRVRRWYEGQIDYVETNSAMVIGAKYPEYNPDWCDDDAYSESSDRVEETRNAYLDALADNLLVNYSGE